MPHLNSLSDNAQVQTFLPLLRELADGRACFLVGGAIRDWLLNCNACDFDFATPFDPTDLSRAFAKQLGGHWFYLDEKRKQVRVVADLAETRLTFDFAPYRAMSLDEDLALRDYTINAMAFALNDEWRNENLVDPMRGRLDLSHQRLRLTSEAVLRSDPLRVLKGLRHCLELGFKPDEDTLLRMKQAVSELRLVAAERIRHEMLRILAAPCDTGYCVSLLMETGVGRLFWGDHFVDSDQALIRTQFRSIQFQEILGNQSLSLQSRLQERVEDGVTRATLLNWFFLLETIYPGCALETAQQWRFSRNAQRRLEALEGLNGETWLDFEQVAPRRRSLLLWAGEQGADPIDLLLAMAFSLSVTPSEAIERVLPALSLIISEEDDWSVNDLLDGHELQKICNVNDGRQVGEMIAKLRRAEAYGQIENRGQAEALVQGFCNEKD